MHHCDTVSVWSMCINRDVHLQAFVSTCEVVCVSVYVYVCAAMVLLLSYQSDVNWRFNFQWIIYLCNGLGTCTGQGSENIYHTHTHTHTLHVCMHTHTHCAITHCSADLYSRSSYKYLYLSCLIFISSNRAHIRGAAGWWGYQRERGREEEVIEREKNAEMEEKEKEKTWGSRWIFKFYKWK